MCSSVSNMLIFGHSFVRRQSQNPDTELNKKAALLRQYLSVVLDNMPGVFLSEHRTFNKAGHNLLFWYGTHCISTRTVYFV